MQRLPVYGADLEDSCLLGLDYLWRSKACLDFGSGTMRVGDTVVPLLSGEASPELRRGASGRWQSERRRNGGSGGGRGEESGEQRVAVRSAVRQDKVTRDTPAHLRDVLERSTRSLDPEQAGRLRELLCSYADVFSSGDTDLGHTDLVKHRIDTGGAHPIKPAPRRIPPAKRRELEAATRELLAQGVIEKSNSPWSSWAVLVRKKDGSARLCVDYRALNNVTVKDAYLLPRIHDTWSRWWVLAGSPPLT